MTHPDDLLDFTDPEVRRAWRARQPWPRQLWGWARHRTPVAPLGRWLCWAPRRLLGDLDALRGLLPLLRHCTDFQVARSDWPRHGHYPWRVVAYGLPFSRGSGRGRTLRQASRRALKQLTRSQRLFWAANQACLGGE